MVEGCHDLMLSCPWTNAGTSGCGLLVVLKANIESNVRYTVSGQCAFAERTV